ncbi:MAG: GAP family protein [bacterium]|nr:GAP family protein [bacterium]MDZ4247758.1 GAP family protein [Patescibacteria group bacterium]
MDTGALVLAIPMMAGPQVLSSIIFVTGRRPVRTSVAYVVAIAAAIAVGLGASTQLAHLFNTQAAIGGSGGPTKLGTTIQLVMVGVLIFLAVRSYLTRATSKPPKWLAKLQSASPKEALLLGVLLIFLMPTDVVIVLTTGFHLESEGKSVVDGLPLVAATTLLAALPLILYLLFRRRATVLMPRVRNWMSTNSWLVNIIIYLLFVALILF